MERNDMNRVINLLDKLNDVFTRADFNQSHGSGIDFTGSNKFSCIESVARALLMNESQSLLKWLDSSKPGWREAVGGIALKGGK